MKGSNLLRSLLHRAIRVVITRRVAVGVAALALLGVAISLAGGFLPVFGRNAPSVESRAIAVTSSAVAPAPATEQYLEGSRTFNAKLIWDALSPDVRATAEARGETLESLQKQLDATKSAGGRVEEIRYIGGFVPEQGDALYFYVVSMVNPSVSQQPQHVFYVFTVGSDGKIKDVQ